MDHLGEEKIPAHVKLCIRLNPAVDFSPAHHRVSLFSMPGKKSSTPEVWKISSRGGGGATKTRRRGRRDPEAMATATGRLSPPAATFSLRWEHCSW
uniref:Uncharacterized protein n=1 Tax=Oryza barthii TaxID=65489 RepID=A0A0D3FLD8_9ORYZ